LEVASGVGVRPEEHIIRLLMTHFLAFDYKIQVTALEVGVKEQISELSIEWHLRIDGLTLGIHPYEVSQLVGFFLGLPCPKYLLQ